MTEIIETKTIEKAEDVQSQIHNARVEKYRALGYTIINNEIVPKNAMTGLDDLTATRTKIWDAPQTSPDDTSYIMAETDVPNVPITGTPESDYTRRDLPPEWSDPDTMEDKDFNTQFKQDDFE